MQVYKPTAKAADYMALPKYRPVCLLHVDVSTEDHYMALSPSLETDGFGRKVYSELPL